MAHGPKCPCRSHDNSGSAADSADSWLVANRAASSLSLWTAFEAYDLDSKQLMDNLMCFTCEPSVAVSNLLENLAIPEKIHATVMYLVKLYVSRAAFAGSETAVSAPSGRHQEGHRFLLDAGVFEQRIESSGRIEEYQLTEQFAALPRVKSQD